MAGFEIATVAVAGGRLGLCPVPGGRGDYPGDLATVMAWAPRLVLTMLTEGELVRAGAAGLPSDLALRDIGWWHLPVADFAAESEALSRRWADVSGDARAILTGGEGVLVHCRGGCGRSGMAALRLMVEAGEDPDAALQRLRAARPCAVETEAQLRWATLRDQS